MILSLYFLSNIASNNSPNFMSTKLRHPIFEILWFATNILKSNNPDDMATTQLKDDFNRKFSNVLLLVLYIFIYTHTHSHTHTHKVPLQDDECSKHAHQVCNYAVESTVMHQMPELEYSETSKFKNTKKVMRCFTQEAQEIQRE